MHVSISFTEKIEREIEAFYEDYSDQQINEDDIGNIHQKYTQPLDKRTDKKISEDLIDTRDYHFVFTANMTNGIPQKHNSHQSDTTESNIHVSFVNDIQESAMDSDAFSSNWPKFQDILLAIGKRYDWKNDRWIKVKKKLKETRTKRIKENRNVNFYEKHKFRYRTVKLSGRKSRRNVVIAVSAVR